MDQETNFEPRQPVRKKEDYDPTAYKPETTYKKEKIIVEKSKGGFWRTLFIVIGVIAVIFILMVIGAIVALILIKPYGLDVTKLPGAYLNMTSDAPSSYDHPLLSTDQEKLLESMGIDTATIPTTITPAQEQCAIDVLGADRVNEIKAGATPSLGDYLKAKDCL